MPFFKKHTVKVAFIGFIRFICKIITKTTTKMILEIRLSNFFSIHDEVELDMQAANIQTKTAKRLEDNTFVCGNERLLKTVAIYGANASGKSNIIKAIRACAELIFTSHNNNENTIFAFTPFKFGGNGNPSKFFIRFILDGVEYEYSFELTKTEILKEQLYYYPKGRRALVFSRDETKGPDKKDVYEFQSVIRRPMDVAANTSKKTLFVSRASQMDRDVAKEVFRYFNERFILNFFDYNTFSVERLLKDNKERFLNVLRIADSDIVSIDSHHENKRLSTAVYDPTDNQLLSVEDIHKPQLVITTYHKNNPEIPFNFFTEESEGTKRLFRMMLTILDIVTHNKILLIDEIETQLHIKLVEYIISLFNKSESAQLIYTTHNTHLLKNNSLRKDQIYFVNKREDGSSDLYSLFDYKDFRDGMDIEKAYLQGRFDAIPYIDAPTSNCVE